MEKTWKTKKRLLVSFAKAFVYFVCMAWLFVIAMYGFRWAGTGGTGRMKDAKAVLVFILYMAAHFELNLWYFGRLFP